MGIDEIARSMTGAQKRALMQLSPFIGCRWPVRFCGPYRGIRSATLNALLDRDLIWGRENYSSRHVGLLPTGLAVRAALERMNDDQ